MDCPYLGSDYRPSFWHRLRCADCRSANSIDRTIGLGVEWMREEPAPEGGLARTLTALDITPTTSARQLYRTHRLLGRIALVTGVAGGLAVLPMFGWLYYIDIDPNVKIPAAVPLRYNAFDYFQAAGNRIDDKDEKVIQAAARPAPKPADASQSTFPTLPANAPPPSGPIASGAKPADPSTKIYTIQDKQRLVQEKAFALEDVRKGLAYPCRMPSIRSAKALAPYYGRFRSLARLLSLEAQVKEARGDWNGAVSSDLDAMQMGCLVQHNAPIIGKLSGMAYLSIGREGIWRALNHLNAAQAFAASDRLQHIMNLSVSAADTLQEEKWCTQAELLEIMRNRNFRLRTSMQLMGVNSTPLDAISFYLRMLPYSKQQIFSNLSHYLDQCIEIARSPYRESHGQVLGNVMNSSYDIQGVLRQEPVRMIPHLSFPEPPTDPISMIIAPTYNQISFLDAGHQTENELLLMLLALRAYRVENGGYPAHAEQLVPRYLSRLPADPFGNGPLCYRLENGKPIVYSIGPDGQDDLGKPIENIKSQYDSSRRRVGQDSLGDIVAGVNTSIGGE